METKQITMQNALQYLLSHRKYPIYLAAGEWCVQKEPNFDVLHPVTELFSQHTRHKHQVVVMNPNYVIVFHRLRHFLSKDAICVAVCYPCVLIEADFPRVVVE
jgi:hypothetical protein